MVGKVAGHKPYPTKVSKLGLAPRLSQRLAAGDTIKSIQDELNAELERQGRPERLSTSGVYRAACQEDARTGLLAAKQRQDKMMETMRKAGGPPGDALEQRLELMRTLLFDTASQALVEGVEPLAARDLRDIASALLNTEKAGHLSDLRIAEAEARARTESGKAGAKAARRLGLSVKGAAEIRAAIESGEE